MQVPKDYLNRKTTIGMSGYSLWLFSWIALPAKAYKIPHGSIADLGMCFPRSVGTIKTL